MTGGLFETQYPLGHGQMAAIQAINKDERLIAVQGAPGTGKTTLFKSLIAQQLVSRALSIADGKDQNFGMLVTSTAIKAVENIIDDLRNDPQLKVLTGSGFIAVPMSRYKMSLPDLSNLSVAGTGKLQRAKPARFFNCFTQTSRRVELLLPDVSE